MPKWIETESYIIEYGYESENKNGTTWLCTPGESLDKRLDKFRAWAKRHQLTIKGISPITTALYAYEAKAWDHGGWGYGFGTSQVTGIIILLEKEIEVTESQYAELKRREDLTFKIQQLNEEKDKTVAIISDSNIKSGYSGGKLTLTEVPKFLGGKDYYVGGKKFKTREEAEAYIQSTGSELSNTPDAEKLKQIESSIEQTNEELRLLEQKIESYMGEQ